MTKKEMLQAAEAGEGPDTGEHAKPGYIRGRDPYTLALLALILLMAVLYTVYFYQEKLPFKEGGADTYAHLGILRSVEDRMGLGEDLDPDLFPGLYSENERSGINYVFMALVASLPGASDFTALYVQGLFGIAVFLSGIYLLTRTLSGSSRIAFLAAVFSLLIGSAHDVVRGSAFSFVDILACAHYASLVATGLMMLALTANIRFLEKGGWRYYLLQVLLAAAVFNIHLLTGVEYFLVLVLLVAVYAAWNRRISRRHVLLLSLIPASLLLLALWPLYRWWDIFEHPVSGASESLRNEARKYSTWGYFIQGSVIFFIGLPFLLKKERERIFLLVWVIAFAFVSLSFLLPQTVSFYWRFAYVMRIPLLIGLALGLGSDIWRLPRWRTVAIPVILVIVGMFIFASLYITVRRYRDIMGKDGYAAVEDFMDTEGRDGSLAAFPAQGYMLMGISDLNVYSILQGHADSAIVDERNERIKKAFLSPAPEEWQDLLQEYEIDQVLVSRSRSSLDAALLLNGTLAKRNEYFDLYEVDATALDTETWASTPDPKLENSTVVNGFTRFDSWAYFQFNGEGEMTLEPVEAVNRSGGEDIQLLMSSDDPEGALIFINRGYIEVDPSRRYRIALNSRIAQGDPLTYLVFYQYEEPSPQGLLSAVEMKIQRQSGEWTRRNYIVGRESNEKTDIVLNKKTRYVKIGLIPCYKSTGQLEVGMLDISEKR